MNNNKRYTVNSTSPVGSYFLPLINPCFCASFLLKNPPKVDIQTEQSKMNSNLLLRTTETQGRSRATHSPIEMETMLHKTSNAQNWSFPRVSTTRNFVSEKPSFQSRNRFQYLSDLSESREGTYAGAAVTAPYAGVATANTRQDLDTGREEKRNQQRD